MAEESNVLTVRLSKEQKTKLREIGQVKYRSPSMSHTIRLLIEDTFSNLVGEKQNV